MWIHVEGTETANTTARDGRTMDGGSRRRERAGAGKWRRAACIEATRVAHESLAMKGRVVPTERRVLSKDRRQAHENHNICIDENAHMSDSTTEINDVVDLYHACPTGERNAILFVHKVELMGQGDKSIEINALFDDGAMVNTMSLKFYLENKEGMGQLEESKMRLRMANGEITKTKGKWKGEVGIKGHKEKVEFEVIPTTNCWEVLIGKPFMIATRATHDYGSNKITLGVGEYVEVRNQAEEGGRECVRALAEEQRETGDVEIMFSEETRDENIYTRHTKPFKKRRVDEVVKQVRVGKNLTKEEQREVEELIRRYADVFALSMSEVKRVEGTIHKLKIPQETKFSTKARQKPLMPPQKTYLHKKIDEMLDADIIERCGPGDVKCVSPTMLAQKAHQSAGLTMNCNTV